MPYLLALLSLTLLLSYSEQVSAGASGTSKNSTPGGPLPCGFYTAEEAVEYCEQFEDLYQGIKNDLEPWRSSGISLELMRHAATHHTALTMRKGVHLGFSGGKAYVIVGDLIKGFTEHHANIMFTYMHVMLELERLFGSLIPDVEFTIATSDRPMVVKPSRLKPIAGGEATKTAGRRLMGAQYQQLTGSSGSEDPGSHHHRGWISQVSGYASSHLATGHTWQAGSNSSSPTVAAEAQASSGSRQQSQGAQEASLGQHTSRSDQAGAVGSLGQEPQLRDSSASRRSSSSSSGSSIGDGVWQSRALQGKSSRRQGKEEGQEEEEEEEVLPDPIFRFCSSPGHADIQVPIFHFYTKKYSQRLLAHVDDVNAKYPWPKRQPLLFGRFSYYYRHVHPNVSETWRVGANGTRLCTVDTPETATCTVRHHIIDLAANMTELMDIKAGPKLSMLEHARYKYLVHVDGQGLSSRLDQLLPLGSLVLKEESGYTTYYHHLLKPYVHYVPFWVKDPLDMLDVLKWAKANDDKAREIGAAAQAFALKYLSKRARTCYWFHLIKQFSQLLKYKPGPEKGSSAIDRPWIPVQEYFDTVAKKFQDGRWFAHKIEQ